MERRSSRTIAARLHRLTGQLSAVESMLGASRPCTDVLQQINAVRSGLDQITEIIFRRELEQLANKKKVQPKDIERLMVALHRIQ